MERQRKRRGIPAFFQKRAGDANPYKTQAFWRVRKRADYQQKAAPKTQSVFLTEFFYRSEKEAEKRWKKLKETKKSNSRKRVGKAGLSHLGITNKKRQKHCHGDSVSVVSFANLRKLRLFLPIVKLRFKIGNRAAGIRALIAAHQNL